MKRLATLIAIALLPLASKAAVIGLGSGYWYTDTLQTNLEAQGHKVNVLDRYNAKILDGYDAYIQDGNSFFNAGALNTFVNKGGTLIQLPWTFTHNQYSGQTRVFSGRNYAEHGTSLPGISVLDNASYLLEGVTLPIAGAAGVGYEVGNSFLKGVTPVLAWQDKPGSALLGHRNWGDGNIVALNLHLITSDSNPLNADWSNQIIYNAIEGVAVPAPAGSGLVVLGLALLIAGRRYQQAVS